MNKIELLDELFFQAVRSSGPGGQNVNKVNSKVELRFDINTSKALNDIEKSILNSKLKNKINKMGELILVEQTNRSQLKNKQKVIAKLFLIIEKALVEPQKRLDTKPTMASVKRRLEAKKVQSNLKALRKDLGQ